jgi:predicted Fe-Mo cluster-binding NifX family protein
MVGMIIAVNLAGDLVGTGLGRAHTVAVADVQDDQIQSWNPVEVRWDLSHDQPALAVGAPAGSHGSHHARIVTFMRAHQVEAVVTGHVGPPMAHTLSLMGLRVVQGASGDARQAALAAAAG